MNILTSFINLILPPRCIKCGEILSAHNGLCSHCFNQIKFISEPFCHICGSPFNNEKNINLTKKYVCANCLKEKKKLFDIKRSVFIYDEFSKNLILDLKFNDKTINAEILSNMMFSAGKDIWLEKPDMIIAVPLHKLRLIKRKYNQSILLAKHLSIKTKIPINYTSLIRTENTIPQVQLSGRARLNNLKNAFMIKYPEIIKNKKIVLIDDVETTGSTLKECAKILKKAGAINIYALTIARTEN